MHDLNNRVEAQRRVLEIVNRPGGLGEELCGLTRSSIERWVSVNRIQSDGELVTVLFNISAKLFLLSSKSQEHLTAHYKFVSKEVDELTARLEAVCQGLGWAEH